MLSQEVERRVLRASWPLAVEKIGVLYRYHFQPAPFVPLAENDCGGCETPGEGDMTWPTFVSHLAWFLLPFWCHQHIANYMIASVVGFNIVKRGSVLFFFSPQLGLIQVDQEGVGNEGSSLNSCLRWEQCKEVRVSKHCFHPNLLISTSRPTN